MNLLRKITLFISRYSGYFAKVRFALHSWRFENYGSRCSLGKGVSIRGMTNVHLGNRVAIRNDVVFAGGGRISIGSQTSVNESCRITAVESVSIGENCMLASGVFILDVDHVFDNRELPISKQGYRTSKVCIGNDVWLGTGVVITKGVTIGDGAIIAANAVVTKNVPEYEVHGGVPARKISVRP